MCFAALVSGWDFFSGGNWMPDDNGTDWVLFDVLEVEV